MRPDRRLLVAGGTPGPEVIRAAVAAARPRAEAVATGPAVRLLEDGLQRRATRAIIHRIGPAGLTEIPDLPSASVLAPDLPLDHLHGELRREVDETLGLHPIGVVLDGETPVSFCYPTLVTERYWDITIETLEGYRRSGRAAAAFFRVEREMRLTGRQPVWGAAENNPASLALAAKLGFVPVAEVGWIE